MPTMPHEIVVDHDNHRILIDDVEYPHYVGEDIAVSQDGRLGTVDLTLMADKVTEVGTSAAPEPGVTIGSLDGSISIRLPSGAISELGSFTLPVTTTTKTSAHGVDVTVQAIDKLRRATAAFEAILNAP